MEGFGSVPLTLFQHAVLPELALLVGHTTVALKSVSSWVDHTDLTPSITIGRPVMKILVYSTECLLHSAAETPTNFDLSELSVLDNDTSAICCALKARKAQLDAEGDMDADSDDDDCMGQSVSGVLRANVVEAIANGLSRKGGARLVTILDSSTHKSLATVFTASDCCQKGWLYAYDRGHTRPQFANRTDALVYAILEVVMARLAGTKCFIALDWFKGYWQLAMEASSREAYTIMGFDEMVESNRVLMGQPGAVAFCQSVAQTIYGDRYGKGIEAWLGDVLGSVAAEPELPDLLEWLLQRAQTFGLKFNPLKQSTADAAVWCEDEAQNGSRVKRLVVQQEWPRELAKMKEKLVFEDDVGRVDGKIWIPTGALDLQLSLLVISHADTMGHRGGHATARALSDIFVWRGLEQDCKTFVANCLQSLSVGGEEVPRPVGKTLHAVEPNQLIHCDFMALEGGYVHGIVDDASTFCQLTWHDAKDATITQDLLDHITYVDGGHEIEALVDCKFDRNLKQWMLLVKWRGLDELEKTWEPVTSSLETCLMLCALRC
ncbi:hypothetical protein H310_09141 [Aphanomyces invadans]|uniref:Chromo domain-containing protein n=1 Tax=Aphanomyces invadans TaxID=157072 RepID=A0A024TUX9_9STRA|nr:hypothetical protein H310_09141 [Aphanomyces invadans]ETV97789.1 hypothetical protein H310_09141 [Aphanomyces invadans]|eukprot:XP_008873350.1 hypothetical protein H310_09141 [Aphanomyces invadans]